MLAAFKPLCKRCAHWHFTNEPCVFGDVIDARARFAAKRSMREFVEVDFDPLYSPPGFEAAGVLVLEDQLRQCMATGEGFDPDALCIHPAPIRPDGIRSLGQIIADHDDDGRVIE